MITFYLNGKRKILRELDVTLSVANYLRSDDIRLMGTKKADEMGALGADTVMISWCEEKDGKLKVNHRAISAVNTLLVSLHGMAITTVEGIGNMKALHPIQNRFIHCDAAQCGYCTGGFLMSFYSLLKNKALVSDDESTEKQVKDLKELVESGELKEDGPALTGCSPIFSVDIEECFDGNICRCTGYRPIAEAVAAYAIDASRTAQRYMKKAGPTEVIRMESEPSPLPRASRSPLGSVFHTHQIYDEETGEVRHKQVFARPNSLSQLKEDILRIRGMISPHESIKIIGGDTWERTSWDKQRNGDRSIFLLKVSQIKEMRSIELDERTGNLLVGGSATLSELLEFCREEAEKDKLSQSLREFTHLLSRISTTQIRNQTTLGGAINVDHGFSDTLCALSLLNASVSVLDVSSIGMERSVLVSSLLKSPLSKHSVITRVSIPPSPFSHHSSGADVKQIKKTSDTPTTELVSVLDVSSIGMERSVLVSSLLKSPLSKHSVITRVSIPPSPFSHHSSGADVKQIKKTSDTPVSLPSDTQEMVFFFRQGRRQRNCLATLSLHVALSICVGTKKIVAARVFTGGIIPSSAYTKGVRSIVQVKGSAGGIQRCVPLEEILCGISFAPSTDSEGMKVGLSSESDVIKALREIPHIFTKTTTANTRESLEALDKEVLNSNGSIHSLLDIKLFDRHAGFRADLAQTFLMFTVASVCSQFSLFHLSPEMKEMIDFACGHSRTRETDLPYTERDFPDTCLRVVGKNWEQKTIADKVTGTCVYPSDMTAPMMTHGAYVSSPYPHAKILSIDASEALAVPGVVCFVDASDIRGVNAHCGIRMDIEVFAAGTAKYMHQPVGLVTAVTSELARYAAKLVRVEYEVLESTLTIRGAMEKNSYHGDCGVNERVLELGATGDEFYKILESCDHVIEGEQIMGGQDHMYMETQVSLVVPGQENSFHVYSSTQNPGKVQYDVGIVLGIESSKVRASVMQIGGGFGGKQDQPSPVATRAAVAAQKSGRPVRLSLERREDMRQSGGRHAFYIKYKAGVTAEGRYVALDILYVTDGGYEYDVSAPVLDKCIFQSPSTYTIPNMRVEGRIAQTNTMTCTAYRGFGAPQSTQTAELVMDHIARTLGKDGAEIRALNLTQAGDIMLTGTYDSTQFAQENIQRMWDQVMKTAQVKTRKESVAKWNSDHKYIKRGLAIMPLKNASCFEELFMNQASAAVHVYRDGTVAVSHSGIEMGQGLHTKMAAIAAEGLGVSLELVRCFESDTHICPNSQPTAASSGADLNGRAIKECCDKIRKRLDPFLKSAMENYRKTHKESEEEEAVSEAVSKKADYLRVAPKFPKEVFANACCSAYFSAVKLTELVHIMLGEDVTWDWKARKGVTGLYYGYGVGCAEVELNPFTGVFRVVRQDLLEDSGTSLNPFLDAGQVEGGYTMGLGLLTSEEMVWDETEPQSQLQLDSMEYMTPGISDVPVDVRTALLKDHPCKSNIYGSKAAAETPVLLATSVFLAVKECIAAFRKDRGIEGWFRLDTPCTFASIRKACWDE
ncbi:Xanthine dehydrogenase/oxidase [Aduncisulcus paluster]|uniref:Xanthine dehydrogenase/oxidase n=1 Tax=Aduncisulcus paluster TaxID=2918883 RepID=A0ABQ5JQV9_9EUKA|nr:Xanthine dehydrogenase/oxidase [Aduncisulcus paluster]